MRGQSRQSSSRTPATTRHGFFFGCDAARAADPSARRAVCRPRRSLQSRFATPSPRAGRRSLSTSRCKLLSSCGGCGQLAATGAWRLRCARGGASAEAARLCVWARRRACAQRVTPRTRLAGASSAFGSGASSNVLLCGALAALAARLRCATAFRVARNLFPRCRGFRARL